MQIPRFDSKKGVHDVVGSFDCPTCNFKSNTTTVAELLNSSHIRCPKCGIISIGEHLLSERTFKPTSLIRQLVQVAAPILDHLGPGNTTDFWEFTYLWCSRSFLVQRKIDKHYVRLEFNVTYESDCQIAQGINQTSPKQTGFVWDRNKYEKGEFGCGTHTLPPGIAALLEKLAAEHFRLWGLSQPWANTSWIKGDYHDFSKTHSGVRGVRLGVSWR